MILLAALFATSNDFSLRVLGTPRWKRLQRWNYAVFAFAAVQAIGYLAIEKQKLPFIVLVGVLLGIAIVMQAAGFMLRYKNGRSPSPTQC